MKNKNYTYILLLPLMFSCKQGLESRENLEGFTDTLVVNEVEKDSTFIKVNSLIESTKNSETKIKDIKKLKTENISLKQELKETKAELEIVKEKLGDTTIVKKKKKGFIQKLVETIKKDTI
jgi:hypothetical protein